MMIKKWVFLFVAGLLLSSSCGRLLAQGNGVRCDTLRMTWMADSGEIKKFSFAGTRGGDFVLYWGDGDTTHVYATGEAEEVSHIYAQENSFEVLLCGTPMVLQESRDVQYVETAFDMALDMVYVQGGTFLMGATSEQGDAAREDERPAHMVSLDGFYIGKYEVTQAQWEAVMGTTVAQQRDKLGSSEVLYNVGDTYPMYYISWNEAVTFCEKLSARTGKKYRLPTEAEWEYAARGGQKTDGAKYAGGDVLDEVAWYNDNSYALGESHPDYGTHPVGTKKPNGLGLYDMSGNVWEWCSDWLGYYNLWPVVNPQGDSVWPMHIFRGGGFAADGSYCRVTSRYMHSDIIDRAGDIGFRVVCEEEASPVTLRESPRAHKGESPTGQMVGTHIGEVDCFCLRLTSLDVSGCTLLSMLDCSGNQLTSLNVSQNIFDLRCNDNQLTVLDVSGCGELTYLECDNNPLVSLDASDTRLTGMIRGCVSLKELFFRNNLYHGNRTTWLDVSGCSSLTTLDCSNSSCLFSLDVSGCTMLTKLDCSNVGLETLDVTKNANLESLSCYGNRLTSLDLTGNMGLRELLCYDNRLWVFLDKDNGYDLSTLTGMDVARIDSVTGGHLDGSRLIFETDTVVYRYATGYRGNNDAFKTVNFSLKSHYRVIPTANEATLSAAPIAYVQGRTAYLADGLGEVEAFTATGQRVYRGTDRTITLPRPGIYVLRVVADGRRCKVVVK